MTFEAKVVIPLNEHFFVHGAVWIMAGGAAFTDCFVFENKGAALGGVALHAGVLFGRHAGSASFDRPSLVRIVTITA